MEKRNVSRYLLSMIPFLFMVAACGDDERSVDTAEQITQNDGETPQVKATYYPNGIRVLSFFNDQENYADIIEFCDGNDLVEQTALSTYGSGAAGNAIARTIDHPACLDGMLTPSDFEV